MPGLIAPQPGIIRRDHPLWRGLVFAMPGWTPDDIVGGMRGTLNGSMATTIGPYGPAISQSSAAGSYLGYSPVDDAVWKRGGVLSGPATVMAVHVPTSTTDTCILTYAEAHSQQVPFTLVWSIGGNSKYCFGNDNDPNGPQDANTAALNVPHVVIGRRFGNQTASPNMDLRVDGAIVASTTNTTENTVGNSSLNTAPFILSINRWGGYAGYYGDGIIPAVYVWSRALADGECRALTEDPWCLFRRPSWRSLAARVAAASSTGSLAVTLGSATASGSATISIAGAASTSLASAAVSAAGVLGSISTGALVATLSAAGVSSDGAVSVSGALADPLAAATSSAAGTTQVAGSLSATLGQAASSSAGTVATAGAMAKTLASATSSASGAVAIAGAAAKTLAATALDASGAVGSTPIAGTLTATLAGASLALQSILVSWDASTDDVGVTGYSLERSVNGAAYAEIADVDALSYLDTDVVEGDVYAYRVRAHDAAGNYSGYSSVATILTSASGTVLISGSAAKTAAAATSSAAGTVAIAGALAKTIGPATSSAAGAVAIAGASAKTLAAASLSATGALGATATGSLSAALAPASCAAAGTLAVVGSLARSLAAATLFASSEFVTSGSLAQTLQPATATASGTVPIVGALAKTLATASVAAVGAASVSGAALKTLGAATTSAGGTVAILGAVAPTLLADITLSATGQMGLVTAGSLSATLGSAGVVSSGATVVGGADLRTLGDASVSAAGHVDSSAVLAAVLGANLIAAGAVEIVGGCDLLLGDVGFVARGAQLAPVATDIFTLAFSSILADPNFGREAIYRSGGIGDGIVIRVVPLLPDDDAIPIAMGDMGLSMVGKSRSFRVLRDDFPGAGPTSGDTIYVDRRLWRVRNAHERTPLSSIWQIDCSPLI